MRFLTHEYTRVSKLPFFSLFYSSYKVRKVSLLQVNILSFIIIIIYDHLLEFHSAYHLL